MYFWNTVPGDESVVLRTLGAHAPIVQIVASNAHEALFRRDHVQLTFQND